LGKEESGSSGSNVLEVAFNWDTSPSISIKHPVVYGIITGQAASVAITRIAVLGTTLTDREKCIGVVSGRTVG